MDGWVVVPKWEEFQHYKDRDPTWIKNYTRLLHDDAYDDLTLAAGGLLHIIWMLYAASGCELRTSQVHRQALAKAGSRHFQAHMDSLIRAGFVQVVASRPLAQIKRREEKKDLKILATPPKAKELELEPATPTSGREHRPYDKPTDSMATIRRLIGRTIRDNVDLDIELRSGDHHLTQTQISELRAML